MNIKDIAALAEIVKQNELTKLEINGEISSLSAPRRSCRRRQS